MGLKIVKTGPKKKPIEPIRVKDPVFGVQDDGHAKLLKARESKRPTGGNWVDKV